MIYSKKNINISHSTKHTVKCAVYRTIYNRHKELHTILNTAQRTLVYNTYTYLLTAAALNFFSLFIVKTRPGDLVMPDPIG